MTDETQQRLDRLESLVGQQQDRIQDQQEPIERQRERIAELEDDDAAPTETDDRSAVLNRRNAITAGGLLALLGVGTGTASADAQGQVGTGNDPLTALYTAEPNGDITDGTALTTLAGTDLSIDDLGAATDRLRERVAAIEAAVGIEAGGDREAVADD